MIELDRRSDILDRLQEVRRLCPEMRFGQLLATIGMLGEDASGLGLWDIEDEAFSAAVERLTDDLRRRADA